MFRPITAAIVVLALTGALCACRQPATPPNFKKEPAIAPLK